MAGVHIEGLAELRATLARMAPELDKSVGKALDDSAGFVAEKARANAPRVSGRLRGSIATFSDGATAGVRVTAVRISRRYPGGYAYPVKIERQRSFLARAIVSEQDRVTKRMEKVLDDVAKTFGGA